MEETGLELKNIRTLTFTNDVFQSENKHYITLFVMGEVLSSEAKLMEPESCAEWIWFNLGNFPQPLFLPIQNLIKNGFDFNIIGGKDGN